MTWLLPRSEAVLNTTYTFLFVLANTWMSPRNVITKILLRFNTLCSGNTPLIVSSPKKKARHYLLLSSTANTSMQQHAWKKIITTYIPFRLFQIPLLSDILELDQIQAWLNWMKSEDRRLRNIYIASKQITAHVNLYSMGRGRMLVLESMRRKTEIQMDACQIHEHNVQKNNWLWRTSSLLQQQMLQNWFKKK